ncbi:hypothetical protein V6N11_013942 [Hibiscus sabdariffa]|uniref:Uncharacterized protein n=2 Tax=Hibiscus sabdariffa TaxID=183260 RepID=A0ABR2A2E8_9ROSI
MARPCGFKHHRNHAIQKQIGSLSYPSSVEGRHQKLDRERCIVPRDIGLEAFNIKKAFHEILMGIYQKYKAAKPWQEKKLRLRAFLEAPSLMSLI